MYRISLQKAEDAAAIDRLMAEAFGPKRHARSVWQLRPGPAVDGLCIVARDGDEIVGSLRFWEVRLGIQDILLLGPLAVLPSLRGRGCGQESRVEVLDRPRASRCG